MIKDETKNIIKQTCLTYGIEPEKINQRCRNKKFIECKRQIAYQLRKQLNMPYNNICKILNIKYHTVKYHIFNVEQQIKTQRIKQKIIQIKKEQIKRTMQKNNNEKMIQEILEMFPERDKNWAIKVLTDAINWNPNV